MNFLEDRLPDHLSSLFKTQHPDFIPQLSCLNPKSTKLWESLSREILTPFAPKHKLYNFEKYLPQIQKTRYRKSIYTYHKTPSFENSFNEDSNGTFSENNSIDTPGGMLSPRNTNLTISRMSNFSNYKEKKGSFLRSGPLLMKKLGKNEVTINENAIYRRSHSITIEYPVEMLFDPEKHPPNTKSKLDKLRSFALSKKKSISPSSSKQSLKFPKYTEVFRPKSCCCRLCGKNGKLQRITTRPVKSPSVINEREKPLAIPLNKISVRQSSFNNLPKHHNSLQSEEKERSSFKDLRSLELQKYRMSMNSNIIVNSASAVSDRKGKALPQVAENNLINNNSPCKMLGVPKKNSSIIDKKSFFAKNNVGALTERSEYIEKTPLLNLNKTIYREKSSLSKKYKSGHIEPTTDRSNSYLNSFEKSMELSEIVYSNGCFRTKQMMVGEVRYVRQKIKEMPSRSPYLVGVGKSLKSKTFKE